MLGPVAPADRDLLVPRCLKLLLSNTQNLVNLSLDSNPASRGFGDYTRTMRYLHTMLRVQDLDRALDFFVTKLGLRETRRRESDKGRFTLVFLSSGAAGDSAEIELTYNWDQTEPYPTGRFFGHLAYAVDDIYETCERLRAAGVDILRPPRDGHMAFVKSPDGHSIELLQRGDPLPPQEPWSSMQNQGSW
jgi:lactoylglutathione lyase